MTRLGPFYPKTSSKIVVMIGLSGPIENYKTWWETIERVEIVSGQVIQPGTNPLKIQIKLKSFLIGGGILEDENIFSIIADDQSMRLLIDEVETTPE